MSTTKSTTPAPGSNVKLDVTASVGAFIGTKAEAFSDARFLQYVTVQTTVACMMYLAEQEAFVPKTSYEYKAIKMDEDGINLTRTKLANAGRKDRNQHKDGRQNDFTVLRNWLANALHVDDQVATKTLEFTSRLLDFQYGLRDWNGRINMDASGKLVVTAPDGEAISDKRNDDLKPWEVAGLFRIKPMHVFTLSGKPVPEVDVCDLIKTRDEASKMDVPLPYPWETQALTLTDRSYVFAYEGREKMHKRPWESKRVGMNTFMAATDAWTKDAAAKAKAAADAAEAAKTGTPVAPAAAGTPAPTGSAPATGTPAAPANGAPAAAPASSGTGTGERREGQNKSRDDEDKASRDLLETINHMVSALPPAALAGKPVVISAVMRLHLHTAALLRDLGLVEFLANPNEDTRKAAARELSLSGGKRVTPAPSKTPPAKPATAATAGKRSK